MFPLQVGVLVFHSFAFSRVMICLRFFVFFDACQPTFLNGLWIWAMFTTPVGGEEEFDDVVGSVCPLLELVGDAVMEDAMDETPVVSSSSSLPFRPNRPLNCFPFATL